MPSSGPQRHPALSFRGRHRARAHESAHSDGDADAGQIHRHPDAGSEPAELITSDAALAGLIGHVRDVGSFAYDSEFIGEMSYNPRLCLIQVATTSRVALVDPLADGGLDLTPFWELLCDPAVEKVVHAGEQDLEPATRILGRSCANVLDTQIAAGFIGMAYPVALAKLILEVIGAKLGKALTFTHWDQRPLSAQQLRYAANDVRYLPATRIELGKRLDALGHAGWASEASSALCDPKRYQFDPETEHLRMRGAGTLTGAGLAVLRELVIWRDAMARQVDVPPRAFLRDEILIDMSRRPIKAADQLTRVRGLPRPVEHEHGQAIVELTARALAGPRASGAQIKHVEPTPTERFRTDALWTLVQVLAAGRSTDPALVASRSDVAELSRLLRSGANVDAHPIMQGWRREAVGARLIEIVRSGGAVNVNWADESLRAT